jgi:hypothetical protein
MDAKRYVVIAGSGRSGTNFLLQIFDQNRQTHCRNEPEDCAGSAMSKLLRGLVASPELDSELERQWDAAVAQAAQSFGLRDHPIPVDKDQFSRLAKRIGLARLARSKRARRILNRARPSPLPEEWPIPSWIMDSRINGQSLPVLKILGRPGWITWMLRNRPEAHVVHIVRHAGGYLNSIATRVWSIAEPDRVAHSNRQRLVKIAAQDPTWGALFGDVSSISPVDAELWYWRYLNETIHRAGEGKPQYRLVVYEELVDDPVKVSRAIFRWCGLEWDAAIERRVQSMSVWSRSIAAAWRDRLDAAQVVLAERFVCESAMRGWWGATERNC